MRRRALASRQSLILDDTMIQAVASMLERRVYPAEMLLDSLWLLFSKAAFAENVDGFVSCVSEQEERLSLGFQIYRISADLYPMYG